MGHCNKLLKYSLKIKRYKTFPLGEIALQICSKATSPITSNTPLKGVFTYHYLNYYVTVTKCVTNDLHYANNRTTYDAYCKSTRGNGCTNGQSYVFQTRNTTLQSISCARPYLLRTCCICHYRSSIKRPTVDCLHTSLLGALALPQRRNKPQTQLTVY